MTGLDREWNRACRVVAEAGQVLTETREQEVFMAGAAAGLALNQVASRQVLRSAMDIHGIAGGELLADTMSKAEYDAKMAVPYVRPDTPSGKPIIEEAE